MKIVFVPIMYFVYREKKLTIIFITWSCSISKKPAYPVYWKRLFRPKVRVCF